MKTFEQFLEESLKDPKVRKEYDRLGPRFKVISDLIALRIKRGMTQADIARKLGTKQSAIARIESGDENMTIDSIQRISEILGAKVKISIN